MQFFIPASDFYKYKKLLDGYVFWKQEKNSTFFIQQAFPNKQTRLLLHRIGVETTKSIWS